MKTAHRLSLIPPYLFAEIDKKKQAAMARGIDIVNLGIGDPDLPTPKILVEALQKAVEDPDTHNYPPYEGTADFRKAVSVYYQDRFGVDVDPATEVIGLIGSKEGIAHIALAFVDPGDVVLLTNPGYPVYNTAAIMAGGTPYHVPIHAETGYFPDFNAIPSDVARKAKMFYINYPNNPTSAVVTKEQLKEAVAFAKEYDILLCHDLAYSEVCYDGYRSISILEVEGAKDVAIEFNSLSKTFNMTGWRIGMAVGAKEAIAGLGAIKTNVDSGVFKAIQKAAIFGLLHPDRQKMIDENNAIFQARRDKVVAGLKHLGWNIEAPKASFYLWLPVPKGYTSAQFAGIMLDECGIVVSPGTGYGEYGEGYFRMTLTAPDERFDVALQRMADKGIRY